MISWVSLINIGDTAVMIPMFIAILAWLFSGNSYRAAILWCTIFLAGFALVVGSKIAFLGWGFGIRSIDFKALSGHAMLTTAIMPIVFYVLLKSAPTAVRAAGVALGMAAGIIMGYSLVVFNFHTTAEVLGGYVVGSMVSLGFINLSRNLPFPRPDKRSILVSTFAFLVVWYANPSSTVHWIVKAALYLSGHHEPYNWSTWQLDI